MAEDMGERTEQPTARRLSEARNRGQVPKSQDLSAALSLGAGVIILAVGAGYMGRSFMALMREVYGFDGSGWETRVDSIVPLARMVGLRFGRVLFPLLLATFVIAWIGQFVQVGWLVSLKPLQPKLSKLNPIAGAKRLVEKRNLVKSGINTLKLLVVMGVAVAVIARWVPRILQLPTLGSVQAMIAIGKMMMVLAIWLVAILLIIGIIDWLYQRWQHIEDLKMTKQQVKDERRSMEGDPQVKSRRFKMMREIAMQQIQQQVPLADVVVTNPTHYAVALRYDAQTMNAPKVVAKGADFMAQRIRIVAAGAGVPIVEKPPLARGLYFGVEVGHEISEAYYQAVAELLAYVYRLEEEHARTEPINPYERYNESRGTMRDELSQGVGA